MRIGLNGGVGSVDRLIEQAQAAEADGFSSLWYPSAIARDPVTPMAVAGRATKTIELGTALLQSYTSHPVLQAPRAGKTDPKLIRALLGVQQDNDGKGSEGEPTPPPAA